MRIGVNLAVYRSAHERYALYWAGPTLLGVVVALVCLTRSAVHNFREYGQVQRLTTDCQARQGLLHDREQAALRRLQQPQFQEVLRKAKYINSLIDRRQLSLTLLDAKLIRLLPADVRITALSLSAGGGEPVVRMAIESSGQEKIIAFIQNVEQSHDFSDAVISSEEPGQQGSSGGVARMICTASYRGWQDPDVISDSGDQSANASGPAPALPEVSSGVNTPEAPSVAPRSADPATAPTRQPGSEKR